MYVMKLVKLFYSLLVKAGLLEAAVAELYTQHEFQIFDDPMYCSSRPISQNSSLGTQQDSTVLPEVTILCLKSLPSGVIP